MKKHKIKKKIEIQPTKTIKEAVDKANLYFDNAKDFLAKSSIKDDRYENEKYVREASGMGYLAATIAIRGYLFHHGIIKDRRKLPKSYDQYTMFIKKIPRNGKLMNYFNTVYEILHVDGYYEGQTNVKQIKAGFEGAKKIIDIIA